MLSAIFSPRSLGNMFGLGREEYRAEKVTYVQVVPKPPPVAKAPPAAITRAPEKASAPVEAPPPVTSSVVTAPLTIPTRIDSGGAGGASIGTSATALPGNNPDYTDKRIWSSPTLTPDVPLTGMAKLNHDTDSAMRVMRKQDSIAASRNPTDWTVGEGTKRVGIDPQWIYLGPIKLPTFLLGFVKLPVQGNPNIAEKNRTLGAMAEETRTLGRLREARSNEYKSILSNAERLRAMRKADAARAAGTAVGPRIPPP